jgi:serine/threonine-protein kinase
LSDALESRARARVGAVLNDKWTLERLLGVGGMAAVYAARHRNGARAAVKLLHPELSRLKDVRERFLREGYAANRVEHEGVVKVMDDDVVASGEEAGSAYLVMELLEGKSLQSRLEEGPAVGEREFLGIASAVLEVLEAAHSRGVIHRDLKPENLFLLKADEQAEFERTPRVKVLDFGLARITDGQTTTAYGLALGTPSFMSPEQAAGKTNEIDGRTDIFALATTGFRVRTGRRLHEGAGPVDLVSKMASLPAPPIATVCPDVSTAFARVIDRALKFKKEDRYESATAMREDVQRAMGELDGAARTVLSLDVQPPPASSRRPPRPSKAPARKSLPVLPGRRARHRPSRLPWLVGAAACAAIGIVVWLRWTSTDGPAPEPPAMASGSPAASSAAAASLADPPPAANVSDAAVQSGASSASVRRPQPLPSAAPPPVRTPTGTRRKPR